MLVGVTERTKDRDREHRGEEAEYPDAILIEAVVLSLVGGLAGVLIRSSAATLARSCLMPPLCSVGMGDRRSAVCSAIGVGFGFYPA
jgi:hypothetical protein